MSPILFILAFNPLIHYLQKQEQYGYKLENQNVKNVITLPYADDFCIISTDKRRHQKLINTINQYTKTMGMRLKPSKCRSFSIQQGKPSNLQFKIDETIIPTIFEEEQKFLGKVESLKILTTT